MTLIQNHCHRSKYSTSPLFKVFCITTILTAREIWKRQTIARARTTFIVDVLRGGRPQWGPDISLILRKSFNCCKVFVFQEYIIGKWRKSIVKMIWCMGKCISWEPDQSCHPEARGATLKGRTGARNSGGGRDILNSMGSAGKDILSEKEARIVDPIYEYISISCLL